MKAFITNKKKLGTFHGTQGKIDRNFSVEEPEEVAMLAKHQYACRILQRLGTLMGGWLGGVGRCREWMGAVGCFNLEVSWRIVKPNRWKAREVNSEDVGATLGAWKS